MNKEKEIEMLECMVCDKKTEDLDYCFGCAGLICFTCEHED